MQAYQFSDMYISRIPCSSKCRRTIPSAHSLRSVFSQSPVHKTLPMVYSLRETWLSFTLLLFTDTYYTNQWQACFFCP